MNKRLEEIFEEGAVSLSMAQFEALANRYYLDKLQEPQKKDFHEKLGFWILFGAIFFVGLLLGSRFDHWNMCASPANYTLSCLESKN